MIVQKVFWFCTLIPPTTLAAFYIPFAYALRYIDSDVQYEVASSMFGIWLSLLDKMTSKMYLLEGENLIKDNKSYLVISNHVSEADFLVMHQLFSHTTTAKYLRFVIKSQMKKFYIIYQFLDLLGFLSVERNFSVDEQNIVKYVQDIVHNETPVNLLIFPEGTIYCANTLSKSQEYCINRNLLKYEHVLMPKYRGTQLIAEHLQNSHIDELLDITFTYPDGEPSLYNLFFESKQARVKYKMSVTKISEIRNVKAFITQKWNEKETWLADVKNK